MSLTVIRPRSSNESLTTSTFSMRLRCSSCSTSSDAAPSLTVIRRSFLVMMWRTGSSSSVSKRMSRWVTMPASWPSLPTTGTPEMLCAWVRASTSRMVVSGPTVIGSRMTPASNFLTLATSAACCSRLRFLWMMPMPPSWAMAMARRASVTVSMAADRIGSLSFRSPGQPRFEVDVLGQDGRVGGDERDVVVSECFSLDAQHRHTRDVGSATFYPFAPRGRG